MYIFYKEYGYMIIFFLHIPSGWFTKTLKPSFSFVSLCIWIAHSKLDGTLYNDMISADDVDIVEETDTSNHIIVLNEKPVTQPVAQAVIIFYFYYIYI